MNDDMTDLLYYSTGWHKSVSSLILDVDVIISKQRYLHLHTVSTKSKPFFL